jgi:hypothetical protein
VCAVTHNKLSDEESLAVVKVLVENGADINMATNASCGDSRYGGLNANVRPFEAALEFGFVKTAAYLFAKQMVQLIETYPFIYRLGFQKNF